MKDYTEKLGFYEKPTPMAEILAFLRATEFIESCYVRKFAIKKYGFSIPCSEAVQVISHLSPLVEVGAGSGYWSRILGSVVADIIPTDIGKQSDYSSLWYGYNVEKISAVDAVEKYQDRNVFVSWPTYDNPWAFRMAEKIKSGRSLAYIGEDRGGCTADSDFFDLMYRDFEVMQQVDIPQWYGIHDRLWVYRRK